MVNKHPSNKEIIISILRGRRLTCRQITAELAEATGKPQTMKNTQTRLNAMIQAGDVVNDAPKEIEYWLTSEGVKAPVVPTVEDAPVLPRSALMGTRETVTRSLPVEVCIALEELHREGQIRYRHDAPSLSDYTAVGIWLLMDRLGGEGMADRKDVLWDLLVEMRAASKERQQRGE